VSEIEGLRKAARRIFYEAKKIEQGHERERLTLLESVGELNPVWFYLDRYVAALEAGGEPEDFPRIIQKIRREVDSMREFLRPCDVILDEYSKTIPEER
jgi:hypothetical protein